GADLFAVAADSHVAPGSGAVAREVVEGPLAIVGAAGLHARPGAVRHRLGNRRQQRRQRAARAASAGREQRSAVAEAHAQLAAPRRLLQDLARRRVLWTAVV